MHARLPLRLTRSAAFSAVCVALAALGHTVAGGSGPALWAVVAGSAAVMALSVALSGRERSPATINAVLIGAQVGLHELFGTSLPGPHLPGHGQGLGEGVGMLLAHLTATLITGWWLARGEAALWSMLRRLARTLITVLLPLPAPAMGPAPVPADPRPRPSSPLLRHIVSRRGPPLPA